MEGWILFWSAIAIAAAVGIVGTLYLIKHPFIR